MDTYILQIISANVSTKGKAPLNLDDAQAPFDIVYTYSVKWSPTEYDI